MTIRLLLTLLVLGLSGTEYQASSAPAWVKQSKSITAQATASEALNCEISEQQHDSDFDAAPQSQLQLPCCEQKQNGSWARMQTLQALRVPQARGPPQLI